MRLARILALASLVFVLLATGLVLSLRIPSVRQALLGRISAATEAAIDLSIDADRIAIDLTDGRIALHEVELSAGGMRQPFSTAGSAALEIRWSSLFGDRFEIPSIELSDLTVDLSQPLPAPDPTPPEQEPSDGDFGVDIAHFEILAIELTGSVPGDGDTWLRAWSLEEGTVTGSFVGNLLRAQAGSDLHLEAKWPESTNEERWRGQLELALTVSEDLGFDLQRASLLGDGVAISIVGEGQLDLPELVGSVDARLDPSLFWPPSEDLGALSLSGTLDLQPSRLLGALEVSADALPGEIFDPWLSEIGLGGLVTAGTRVESWADLDLAVDLSGEHVQSNLIRGRLDAKWLRDDEVLLVAEIRADESTSLDPESATRLKIDAAIRPAATDQLDLSASVAIPALKSWRDSELLDSSVGIEIADLAIFLDGLWIPPKSIESWLPSGRLSASASLHGPALAPFIQSELSWTNGEELLLTTRAYRSSDSAPAEPIRVELNLLPDLPGTRRVDASIGKQASGETLALKAELIEPEISSLTDELITRWPTLFPGSPDTLATLERSEVRNRAKGALELHLEARNSWQEPSVELDLDWRPEAGERTRLTGAADIQLKPPFIRPGARGELILEAIQLADWQPIAEEKEPFSGEISGTISARFVDGEDFEGSADLVLKDLSQGETKWLESATLVAGLVDRELSISRFSARPVFAKPELEGAHLEGQGRLDLDPTTDSQFTLRLETPAAPAELSMLDLSVVNGVAELEVRVEGHPGRAFAEIPLGSIVDRFANQEALSEELQRLPRGPARVALSTFSIGSWTSLLLTGDSLPTFAGTLEGELEIDPARPAETVGQFRIMDFIVKPAEGEPMKASGPAVLALAKNHLELPHLELVSERLGSFAVAAEANIDEGWSPGDPFAELLNQVSVTARGDLDSSILNPLLGGGLASGPMTVVLAASDRSGDLVLDLEMDAADASLVFTTGYITRIDSPRLRLRAREGLIELTAGEFLLNRGPVQLEGKYESKRGVQLGATFDQVRYRVDYGLNLILGGRLDLTKRPGKAAVIAGQASVERGVLRRDIFLDREFMRSFSLSGAAADPDSVIDQTELDLLISTREGIEIKNNIADLRLDWGNLLVSGTIGEPLVAGRIDSDPGGWLEALGQLFRIDRLSIELSGDPSVEPVINVETTSLLDDPTLYQQRREGVWAAGMSADSPQNDLFVSEQRHSSDAAMAQFTSGLATHFGDRLARTIGQGATMQFSVQPLPLYGETSSDGRLTLTQRLGMYATFIASSDARQTESVTYILETAELLPRTTLQLFTSDDKNEGATVQIVQPLVRRQTFVDPIPRLGDIEWTLPDTIKQRQIRRAMNYRKGDPFPEGSDFGVEIDVIEALQKMGYPGSSVEVTQNRVKDGRADLAISVVTGPHVRTSFEGLRIPLGFRETIGALYLPSEIDRGASLESVTNETELTLRRLGHIRPKAIVTEEPIAGSAFEENRLLRVISTSEREIDLGAIRFEGLTEEDALALSAMYGSTLSRLELAEALPDADRLLIRRAAALGYPSAEITKRSLSKDGTELAIHIEPGPRQKIASYEVLGLSAEHADLADAASIEKGRPARRSDLSSMGRTMLMGLRERGFVRAELDLSVTPLDEDPEWVQVTFTITPGPFFEFAGSEIRGLEHTKPKFAQSLVDIEPGQPLRPETIGNARRNLFRTNLFEGIDTRLEFPDGSRLADKNHDELTKEDSVKHSLNAVFEAEEGPRFLASYGGRWETTKGSSVIGDLIDRNFRGIGQTLGLRGVYGESESRLRLYYSLPRTPVPTSIMEVFIEGSREDRQLDLCEASEELRPSSCDTPSDQGDHSTSDLDLELDELTARFQLTLPITPSTQARPFLEMTWRDIRTIDADEQILAQIAANGGNEALDNVISPVLGIQIAHDTRSGSTIGGLSEGRYAGFQLSGTHEELGSDLTALEILGEAKLFQQILTLRQMPVVWAHRYRLSVQLTPGGGRVPVFDQYFAGGEYSLRGYGTESFGPGQVQIIVNQELHFPIWSLVTGLAFFDAGNVWDTWDAMSNDFEIFTNVGVGLRFSAFRLDFSVPLDQRDDDPDYQLYFGFGNAF